MLAQTDWATIASFATALGTLVLAGATFSAVRSSNRSARIAEEAFQVNLRPVLVTSRLDDPMQKIRWIDNHWARLDGSRASVELVDGSVYLAISVRNVGSGLGVIFGWSLFTEPAGTDVPHAPPEDFRMQTRDLYIAPADIGFWQAAIREVGDPAYAALSQDIRRRAAIYDRRSLRRPRRRPAHHYPFRNDPPADGGRHQVVPERGAPLELGPARSPLGGRAGRCEAAGTGPTDYGRRPRSKASQRRSYQTS